MKQFKEGQIVKVTESTYYLEAGEIAEVKLLKATLNFVLYFTKEQIVRVSGLAVKPLLSSLTFTKRLPEIVSD